MYTCLCSIPFELLYHNDVRNRHKTHNVLILYVASHIISNAHHPNIYAKVYASDDDFLALILSRLLTQDLSIHAIEPYLVSRSTNFYR